MRMRAILAMIRHPANLFAELEQRAAAANNVVRSAHVAFWRKGDGDCSARRRLSANVSMFAGIGSRTGCRSFPGCRTTFPRSCAHEHRSEEHTSELQSQSNLVCRLLL